MMRLTTTISFHLLLTFVETFDMQCDYVNSGWYIVGNIKNCYARNLTVDGPDQFVDSVNGDTTTILEDVLGFWVQNQVCHYIPQKMVAFMPNLKAFGLSNSGLKTISKFDLAPFPDLIRIAFYGNQLEYIDGDLFTLNTKIQSINLEDNNLLIINGPVLKPLLFLNYVAFKLPCFNKKCEHSGCIPEIKMRFSEKCEFDSIYPGFTKYFKSLKRTVEICNRI
ncbi:uncharacterized protein LOC119083506 [Bradysia coprophila]|uniref:uncharacterized protein LOC119083506 n=1 Tax=Bradysia coprophila TaxID=38358 RepID=UPI00187DA185|nr:uncharacterized protein LOC119083506 [Bradysia coprophila]